MKTNHHTELSVIVKKELSGMVSITIPETTHTSEVSLYGKASNIQELIHEACTIAIQTKHAIHGESVSDVKVGIVTIEKVKA